MLNSVEASKQPCHIYHREWIRKHAIILDPCKHTFMELPHHCYEFGETAKLCHNFPKSPTTDCVKCFGKVDKGHVEVHMLFLAFFLKLSCCKNHVCCSYVFFFLNPHWLSGRSSDCSRYSFNRFSRTLARIFPAIDNKEMPR